MANDLTIKVGVDSKEASEGLKKLVSESAQAASDASSSFASKFQSGVSNVLGGGGLLQGAIGGAIGGGVAGIAMGAIGAVKDLATAAFDEYRAFDKNIQNIGTLGVEAAGLSLDKFEGLINDLSKKAPDSASNIANGVYNAISAGISGSEEEIVKFVETASRVGVAGVADTNAAVNGLTSVVNAYGLGAAGAEQTSNIFFATIKAGKTSFNELNAGLANIVPAASAAGIQFDEVGAAIAKLTTVGIPTAQATTQLRSAIIELQKPAKPLEAVLAKVGLNAANMGEQLKKPAAEGGGLINTLQMVEKAAKESGLSLTQVFGSAEAASAALSVTGKNADSALSIFKGVQADVADGVADKAFGAASKSIDVQLAIIKNNLQGFFNDVFANIDFSAGVQFLIDLFGQVKTIFSETFASVTTSGTDLQGLMQSIGGFIQTYILFTMENLANAIKGVYEIGVYLFDELVAAISPLGESVGGASGFFEGFSKVIEFLIDVVVVAAKVLIDVLAFALGIVAKAISVVVDIVNFGIDIFNKIKDAINAVGAKINEVTSFVGAMTGSLNEGKGVWQSFKDIIDTAWNSIKNIGDAIYNFGNEIITKYFIEPINKAKQFVSDLIDKIKQWILSLPGVQSALKFIQDIMNGIKNFFSDTTKLMDGVKANVTGIMFAISEVGSIAKTIFDNILSLNFKGALDAIADAPRRIKEAFESGKDKAQSFIDAQRKVSEQVGKTTQAIQQQKKAVEQPVVPPPVVDPDKDKDKKDKDTKAKKKTGNAQLDALEDLIAAEEKYRAELQETALAESETGEISKEKKNELLRLEAERLQTLLNAEGKYVDFYGKESSNLIEIGKITIDNNGKVKSGIKGTADEIKKAAEEYEKIQARLVNVQAQIRKAGAELSAEEYKRQLEFLKKSSDDLRKAVPEKITLQYGFKVGAEEFEKEGKNISDNFLRINDELNEALLRADEKQAIEIRKQIEDNKKQEEILTRDYANILERVRLESQTDADKKLLDISLLDLRIKFEKEQKENEGNFTKLQELQTEYLIDRQRLQDEYDRKTNILFGLQSAVQTSLLNQFNVGRLIEERRANAELRAEKQKALKDEESDLEKSLAERSISFEEYQSRIADIQQRRIDAGLEQEKLGEQLLKDFKIGSEKAIAQVLTEQGNRFAALANERAQNQIALDAKVADARKALAELQGKGTLEEFAKAQQDLNKAQADAAKNDEEIYGFRTSVLEEFAGKAAQQFAALAASGTATLADFGKATVQLAFEALQKMIPIYVAKIAGEEFSKGIAGIATTAVLTAALYGLFAAAQSAAGFKDGVVSLEGDGTETSDSIPAWLSKGESVITARATKNNMDELKWMNETGLPIREFYRMQMSHTSVSEDGQLVHEIRQLKQVTENLGVQITRNTKVDVHGVLHADGNSITAMIEANRKRNARRF